MIRRWGPRLLPPIPEKTTWRCEMFHSRLYRKLSLAAAVLGLFNVACWNQNATAAGSDTSKTTTATPAAMSPEAERLQLVTVPKGSHITTTVGQTLESDKNH